MNVVKNGTKPYIDVYVTKIINDLSLAPLSHAERNDEISSISNERLKREKYTAWRLLEHALLKSLDMSPSDAELYKDECGKWHSPHLNLSISHSGSAAAVVISHAPVGIDVEPLSKSLSESFAKKNLTENELAEYESVRESQKNVFLLTRWCIKEAAFKKSGGRIFFPSKIDTTEEKFTTHRFVMNSEDYVCAVSGEIGDASPTFTVVEIL